MGTKLTKRDTIIISLVSAGCCYYFPNKIPHSSTLRMKMMMMMSASHLKWPKSCSRAEWGVTQLQGSNNRQRHLKCLNTVTFFYSQNNKTNSFDLTRPTMVGGDWERQANVIVWLDWLSCLVSRFLSLASTAAADCPLPSSFAPLPFKLLRIPCKLKEMHPFVLVWLLQSAL